MSQQIALQLRRASLWTIAIVLALLGVIPSLLPSIAHAAPAITQRSLTSTSAVPVGTTDLTWTFNTTDLGGATSVDHIEIEFCDSPLASCANVDGDTADALTALNSTDNIPVLPASPTATLGGTWASTGNSATRVDGRNAATPGSGNQITIDKTTADDANNLTGLTIGVSGFTNDDVANRSYYTRMRLYSDAGTTLVWEGVFAQSTSQTLTVNARVQERLDFCVGSTAANDATTSVGAACSNVTGTSVNLGNVEGSNVNVSPVATTNGGDATPTNGVAMVRTNAVNGVVVDYRAVTESGSGQLKVPGATCGLETGVITTDQCFNSADVGNDPSDGATQLAIAPATEMFGMTIAGINCGSTSAYTCDFTNDQYNLRRDGEYNGNGTTGAGTTTFVTDTDQVAGTTNGGYAWLSNGSTDRIASSTASTVKVVDDEAMILKFAATAGITTPTGSYTVQADFIATATF